MRGGMERFNLALGKGGSLRRRVSLTREPMQNGMKRGEALSIRAGGGRFNAPSLRNIGVRAPYTHDDRFTTLAQVIEHYDSGIQPNPNLDRRLRARTGAPQRLDLTQQKRDALVAYLQTLTDRSLLTAAKFSNPVPPQ